MLICCSGAKYTGYIDNNVRASDIRRLRLIACVYLTLLYASKNVLDVIMYIVPPRLQLRGSSSCRPNLEHEGRSQVRHIMNDDNEGLKGGVGLGRVFDKLHRESIDIGEAMS